MRMGMRTYWKDPIESPKRLRQAKKGHQRSFSRQESNEFRKLLQQDIQDGIVRAVDPRWAAYISPVGVVPKKNGKWRMIWDGRVVNEEQVTINFRMEGAETVQRLMLPGDFATSIDLKSAFSHLKGDD